MKDSVHWYWKTDDGGHNDRAVEPKTTSAKEALPQSSTTMEEIYTENIQRNTHWKYTTKYHQKPRQRWYQYFRLNPRKCQRSCATIINNHKRIIHRENNTLNCTWKINELHKNRSQWALFFTSPFAPFGSSDGVTHGKLTR